MMYGKMARMMVAVLLTLSLLCSSFAVGENVPTTTPAPEVTPVPTPEADDVGQEEIPEGTPVPGPAPTPDVPAAEEPTQTPAPAVSVRIDDDRTTLLQGRMTEVRYTAAAAWEGDPLTVVRAEIIRDGDAAHEQALSLGNASSGSFSFMPGGKTVTVIVTACTAGGSFVSAEKTYAVTPVMISDKAAIRIWADEPAAEIGKPFLVHYQVVGGNGEFRRIEASAEAYAAQRTDYIFSQLDLEPEGTL